MVCDCKLEINGRDGVSHVEETDVQWGLGVGAVTMERWSGSSELSHTSLPEHTDIGVP